MGATDLQIDFGDSLNRYEERHCLFDNPNNARNSSQVKLIKEEDKDDSN